MHEYINWLSSGITFFFYTVLKYYARQSRFDTGRVFVGRAGQEDQKIRQCLILYDVHSADKVHSLVFKSGITSNEHLDGFNGKERSSSECYPWRTHTIDFDQEMSSLTVFMEIPYVTRQQNSSEELLSIMKMLTQIHCDETVN